METNEQKNISFSVINSGKVEMPSIEENTSSRTYVNWGADNQYPIFVNNIYKESATVRSIIDGSVRYIVGEGVKVNTDRFKDSVNGKGETMEELVGQIALDYMKYDGFAIEVIYNQLGAISELYVLDMARIRLSANGQKVYYSKKAWGQYSTKFDEYDAFNPKEKDVTKPQIYVYKGYTKNVYPYSSWEGAFRDALSEINSSKYTLNAMINGLAAKHYVSIPDPGNLTEDDKQAVEDALRHKFVGPDAESSLFLYWQTSDKEMKVTPIENKDESQKFETIRKSARQNIFVSFRCSPVLFGLMTESTGFSEQEYKEAFKLYNKTVIQPIQRIIIKSFDKILCKTNSISIQKFDIDFEENSEE